MTATAPPPLDVRSYTPHALHGPDRAWQETNCYVDLWIEVVHSLGLEPLAALPFTVGLDFEGDQYTFYKFPLTDLRSLYGIETQELTIWRPFVEHVVEQVGRGRIVMPEVDSFYLPDTAGVSYQLEHTKSSIGIRDFNLAAREMGYFHNASFHRLAGEDFTALFDVLARVELPPYTELAKLDGVVRRSPGELAALSVSLLRQHLRYRPARNPVTAHRERLASDVAFLRGQSLETFHKYAFATLRQCGSCFELTGAYLRWLGEHGEQGLSGAADAYTTMASQAKVAQFKVARAVSNTRDVDAADLLGEMERGWERAMADLTRRYVE